MKRIKDDMTCPNCGFQFNEEQADKFWYCPNCGQSLAVSEFVICYLDGCKKPTVCIQEGNTITKLGTFQNEKRAKEFVEHITKPFSLSLRGKFAKEMEE